MAGIVLFVLSTAPEVRALDSSSFSGNVAPGFEAVPITRTDFGFVELDGEVLPCGLSVHALTLVQLGQYNVTRVLPQGGIDCDNPTALVRAEATHVVLQNQDPDQNLNYRVRVTFFVATFPYSWVVFPGILLVGGGGILLALTFLRRI